MQLKNSENTLKGKPLSFRLTSLYVWIMVLQVLAIPNSNFCLYNSIRFLKAFLAFLTLKCGPLPRILISCPTTKTDKFPLRGKHLTHIDSPICNSFLCRPLNSNFPGQLSNARHNTQITLIHVLSLQITHKKMSRQLQYNIW